MDLPRTETFLFMFLIIVLSSCSKDNARRQYIPDEQKLYNQIMTGYLKTVRPVVNGSLPLQVLFSIRLNQIVNLSWTDPALSWDPIDFKDVRSLRIPADQVWKPDTFIYNNADNRSTGFIHGTYIQIKHTGEVNWPVPVRLRSSCVVKITYFPFDYQFCMLRFGSWIYSQTLVDYNVKQSVVNVDPSSYIKNSEWDLLSMKLGKSLTNISLGLGVHPHITALLYLKRNTFYYLFNIIVPCMMLSMLTLMTFWLSPTSGEKVTLGLSVFLAFSMFMLLIAEEVPASSDAVPLIGIYLCVVMTMTSISVLCAVLVTNLHNRGSKLRPAPRWVASLFIRYLAQPFGVSQDVQLLASTIFLSDYCKYFILHDSRTANKERTYYSEQDTCADPIPDETLNLLNETSLNGNHQNEQTCHKKQQSRNSFKLKSCNPMQAYPNFQPVQEVLGEEDEADEQCGLNIDTSPFHTQHRKMLSRTYQKVCVQDDYSCSLGCQSYADKQETGVEEVMPELATTRHSASDITSHTPLLFDHSSHHDTMQRQKLLSDTITLDLLGNQMPLCPPKDTFCECEALEEDVWVLREDFIPATNDSSNDSCRCSQEADSDTESLQKLLTSAKLSSSTDTSTPSPHKGAHRRQYFNYQKKRRSWPTRENPKLVLKRAKIMIAEWCTIAKVVDRCLFLFSFIATVFAYVFLLIVMPEGQNINLDNTTIYDSMNTGSYRWN